MLFGCVCVATRFPIVARKPHWRVACLSHAVCVHACARAEGLRASPPNPSPRLPTITCTGRSLHTHVLRVSVPPTAVQNRKVLSMSLGGGGTSAASDTAIANANDLGLGAPVAVAAGNDNEDACNYTPANSPKGV
jgi:hypothetical protein